MTGATRRGRAATARPHRLEVLLSAGERDAVRAAAERAGMATSAWAGEVLSQAAAGGARSGSGLVDRAALRELLVLLGELAEVRRVLRNVGGNLNDVARAANATGVVAEETAAVQRLVARVVRSVDEVVAGVAGWSRALSGKRRAAAARSAGAKEGTAGDESGARRRPASGDAAAARSGSR